MELQDDSTEVIKTGSSADSSMFEESLMHPDTPLRYHRVALEIQKQKMRRDRLESLKGGIGTICRERFDTAAENIGAKLNDDVTCTFDVAKVGLGGARYDLDPPKPKSLAVVVDSQVLTESQIGALRWAETLWSQIPIHHPRPLCMSIKTYVGEYCRIPRERMLIYQRFYKKYKLSRSNLMTSKELPTAIYNVLYTTIPIEDVNKFLFHLSVHKMGEIDIPLFAGIAATAERVLCLSFAEMSGTISPGALRSFKECADFESLAWKIKDIEVLPDLIRLFATLA